MEHCSNCESPSQVICELRPEWQVQDLRKMSADNAQIKYGNGTGC
jgi:hypothetical protein